MSAGDSVRAGNVLDTAPDRRSPRDGIRIDLDAWPRVLLVWPGGARNDREVAAALRRLLALARRREIHGLLVDARHARPPTPSQLGMILDVTRRAGPTSRCVAHAVVTRSPLVRATIDSLRWMHLTPARWHHSDDLTTAIAWLDAQLAARSPQR